MEKNEAFNKIKDLVNEYRAVKYLAEILEAAVVADSGISNAKHELGRLGGDIQACKSELTALDTEVAAKKKLAEDTSSQLKQSMEKAQAAAAEQAKAIADYLKQLEIEKQQKEDSYKQLMADMQRQADVKRATLSRELEDFLAEIAKKRVEAEVKLADTQKAYADFVGKVVR